MKIEEILNKKQMDFLKSRQKKGESLKKTALRVAGEFHRMNILKQPPPPDLDGDKKNAR